MTSFIDFLYPYIIAIFEPTLQFYYFTKFIDRKAKIYHYLFFIILYNLFITLMPASILFRFLYCTAILMFFAILIYKATVKTSLLYALITVQIMQLCYGIMNSFTGILSPAVFPKNPFLISLLFMTLGSIFAFVLSVLCYSIINRYFTSKDSDNTPYIFMILTPILLFSILSEYINHTVYSNTTILDHNGNMLNTNDVQMLLLQFFSLFSLFCIIFAYKKLLLNFKISSDLSMLELETLFQKQYVEEAKLRYENTQAVRHDIKNHLSIIHSLLKKEQIEEAKQYLNTLDNLANDISFPCHTNNPIIDILIGNKLGYAQKYGITVSSTLKVPYPCTIKDIDFCIILSNALDNAIHACQKAADCSDNHIHISGHVQGDFILIEIQNTCSKRELYTKGTGLSNIQSIAEKYHGSMSTSILDGIFCFNILLVIPQQ